MKSEYYANGYDDYCDGVDANPYPFGTAAHADWNSGWIEAQDDEFEQDDLGYLNR